MKNLTASSFVLSETEALRAEGLREREEEILERVEKADSGTLRPLGPGPEGSGGGAESREN